MGKIAKEFFISKSGKDLDDFVDVVFNHSIKAAQRIGFKYVGVSTEVSNGLWCVT